MRQALGGQEGPPDDWTMTANMIREAGKKILSMSSGRKGDKETWWWNEEIQDAKRKRLAKRRRDTERTEERRQE